MTHALKAWADWYVSCAGGNVPHEAQAAYDAISEISRLQAEVDRLTRERDEALEGWHVEMPNVDAAHNAAIDAAAECTANTIIKAAIRALKRQ